MLTQEDVLHIAKLAKIKLSEAEVTKFQGELSKILDFFAVLESAPTDGVAETSQVTGLEKVVREDLVEVDGNEDDLLECTPHSIEDHCVRIPKIM